MSPSASPPVELVTLTPAQRAHFQWLEAPYLEKIVAALEAAEEGSARFVGGCVRDSLIGAAPKDFDIATTLEPSAVVAALNRAGLKAAPTGIDHGTITAIADHQGVEVTTLRADVSTDGRRATVAYTRDWAVDAGRRDFRLNAIYLTPDGRLYDPVGGLADADARRVRFIGDASARIREDYLRILRFFRFAARFSDAFDPEGLAACAALKDGIGQLSAERVGAETTAILNLPRAGFALRAMAESGVLDEIWPEPADLAALERLKAVEPDAAAPLALAVLYGDRAEGIDRRLRLSNAEKAIRKRAVEAHERIVADLSDHAVRKLIYGLGKDGFADALAVAHAFQRIDGAARARFLTMLDDWTAPVFPYSGRHAVAAGLDPGPDISAVLQAAEAAWIEADFPSEPRAGEIFRAAIAARTGKAS